MIFIVQSAHHRLPAPRVGQARLEVHEMKISCVTASYVADLIGYPGDIDWAAAQQAIIQAPLLETLTGILDRLAPAHLDGLEIWYPHGWPGSLTPFLAGEVRRLLASRKMVCCACAGGLPDPDRDPYAAAAHFQTANLLEAPLIAGHFDPHSVPALDAVCARYGVSAAFENGSEQNSAQILSAVAGGGEWIGLNLDTGNLAARGGDPQEAVRAFGDRLLHVHFKDVPAVGSHDCVALGKGIVDIRGVVSELKAIRYDGWLSVEIETGDHDPTDEIIASVETLRRLWS